MTPHSLIPELLNLFPEKPPDEVLFYARGISRLLADNAVDATFGDGEYLPAPSKIQSWLREFANAARKSKAKKVIIDPGCGSKRSA